MAKASETMKRAIIIAALLLLSTPAFGWVEDVCGLRAELAKNLAGWSDGSKGSALPQDEQRSFAEEGIAEMIAAYDVTRDMARDYLKKNGVCPSKAEPWHPEVRR